ncbi:hypothetical protein EZV62_022462 [Acer yangbiense]|uniref:Tf2-1-like SH3-like domain-containing protein n=1 Tax=Acer yangbiense TaxID=1000413 RepID=A0A5C7H871_9ROSI|nr:hypothetical protein EZV62_022462 [Acer yangbiense]
MEDRVQKLEENFEPLSRSQNELFSQVAEQLERLSQQISGKQTIEIGETSANNGRRFRTTNSREASWEDEEDDVVMEVEWDNEEVGPEISLHAIIGIQAPKTMKILGGFKGQPIIALIDSVGESWEVFVCAIQAPKVTFLADFFILPLEGYDVVLGTQWLRVLGHLQWDFGKLQMAFKWENIEVSLTTRKNAELSARFYGPFEVVDKIRKVAYRLKLPSSSRIHPIFHVSVLKQKLGDSITVLETLPTISNDDALLPVPQAVLDQRKKKRKE